MLRPKRPLAGPLILLAVASALALSNLACAKKETTDSWQMQPPVLEMRNANGQPSSLRVSEISKSLVMSSLSGDEASALRFAAADRGLVLAVKSQCRSTDGADATLTADLRTAEEVALVSLVPLRLLSGDGLSKSWACSFKMRVTNGNGSQQDFGFNDVKISFASMREPTLMLDSEIDARTIRSLYPRRLICSSWWIDAIGDRIDEMAHAEKVNGVDTRADDRQPLCSVIELAPKARLVGLYRPAFAGPRTVWNREILLANAYLPDLFHQPVLAWNVRNESSHAQVYFIELNRARIQFAGRFELKSLSDERSWSRPTLIQPVLSVEGALDAKTTGQGFYFRVAARSLARVTMSSNREACPYSRYDFSRVTSMMLITTDQPVILQTLANGSAVTNLGSSSPEVLDNSARDIASLERHTLLSNIVLGIQTGAPRLVEIAKSVSEAMRMGTPFNSSACYKIADGIGIEPGE